MDVLYNVNMCLEVNTSSIFSFLFGQGRIVELERDERCSYMALILGSNMLPLR